MWMLALYVFGNGNMDVSGNMGTSEAVSTRQLCYDAYLAKHTPPQTAEAAAREQGCSTASL